MFDLCDYYISDHGILTITNQKGIKSYVRFYNPRSNLFKCSIEAHTAPNVPYYSPYFNNYTKSLYE